MAEERPCLKDNNHSFRKILNLTYLRSEAYILSNTNGNIVTLPMLRLLSSIAQGCKPLPCHVDIHWIALTEYSQMKFQSFFMFLHHFVLANLATSSIRVNSSSIFFRYIWLKNTVTIGFYNSFSNISSNRMPFELRPKFMIMIKLVNKTAFKLYRDNKWSHNWTLPVSPNINPISL